MFYRSLGKADSYNGKRLKEDENSMVYWNVDVEKKKKRNYQSDELKILFQWLTTKHQDEISRPEIMQLLSLTVGELILKILIESKNYIKFITEVCFD